MVDAARKHTQIVQVQGTKLALADLRWLVRESEEYADDSVVEIVPYREHGRIDFTPAAIIVNGLPRG